MKCCISGKKVTTALIHKNINSHFIYESRDRCEREREVDQELLGFDPH